MILLCIEISAEPGVIGLYENERVIAERQIAVRDRFADEMQSLFDDAKISAQQVSAIAIGNGPGSFTGLRVGLSWAKGFALALGIPVWPLNSLQISAACHPERSEGPRLAVISPARRDHMHIQSFNTETLAPLTEHSVIHISEIESYLISDHILLGPGIAKLPDELLASLSTRYKVESVLHTPRADSIAHLALRGWQHREPPDLDSLTPFYGLDFTPSEPKKES